MRWAMDADDREHHGQPGDIHATLTFGLRRLLLGYTLADDGQGPVSGVLPYDDMEGASANPLGALARFCDRLFDFIRVSRVPTTPTAWRVRLQTAMETLLDMSRAPDVERAAIHSVVSFIANDQIKLSLSVLRRHLESRIDSTLGKKVFGQTGVTFCAMMPMRAIPFKVVVLMGMGDNVFPRGGAPAPFDLMTHGDDTRLGDPDRREEDRRLFLETLMAARQKLIVTYSGQSLAAPWVTHPSSSTNWPRPRSPTYDRMTKRDRSRATPFEPSRPDILCTLTDLGTF